MKKQELMTENREEKRKAAMVDDYRLSLTVMLGKQIKDVTGYISHEFGDRSFKVCTLEFADGTNLQFEGEHDHPYLIEGCRSPICELPDELLEEYDDD